MDDFFHFILFTALYVLVCGLGSRILHKRFLLSEPLVSFLYGTLIGPHFLDVLNTSYFESKEVLFYIAKALLCVQTMSAAMSLPHGYILKKRKSLFALVVLIGFGKYLFTGLVIYYFSKYNLAVSLAMGACLTPTDPVLSSSIIKSKFAHDYVPERLRFLLTAESGINDGFGLLLVYIAVDLLYSPDLKIGFFNLFFSTILYKTLCPAIIGVFVGYLARKVLFYCWTNDMVVSDSFLVYGLALTFFILGLMEILKMSELVGIFFTGTAFSWDEWFVFETRQSRLQDIIDSIFTCVFFVLFGSRIDYSIINATLLMTSVLIICVRRPFVTLILYRFVPEILDAREAIFVGWFGPIGVGALYYSLYFDKIVRTLTYDSISIVVMLSVILHGIGMVFFRLSVNKENNLEGLILPLKTLYFEESPVKVFPKEEKWIDSFDTSTIKVDSRNYYMGPV